MIVEFCLENPGGAYEDLLNKIEVYMTPLGIIMVHELSGTC